MLVQRTQLRIAKLNAEGYIVDVHICIAASVSLHLCFNTHVGSTYRDVALLTVLVIATASVANPASIIRRQIRAGAVEEADNKAIVFTVAVVQPSFIVGNAQTSINPQTIRLQRYIPIKDYRWLPTTFISGRSAMNGIRTRVDKIAIHIDKAI